LRVELRDGYGWEGGDEDRPGKKVVIFGASGCHPRKAVVLDRSRS